MFNSYEMEKDIERHRNLANEKGRTAHLRPPDKPSWLRRFLNKFGSRRQCASTEEQERKPVLRGGH